MTVVAAWGNITMLGADSALCAAACRKTGKLFTCQYSVDDAWVQLYYNVKCVTGEQNWGP